MAPQHSTHWHGYRVAGYGSYYQPSTVRFYVKQTLTVSRLSEPVWASICVYICLCVCVCVCVDFSLCVSQWQQTESQCIRWDKNLTSDNICHSCINYYIMMYESERRGGIRNNKLREVALSLSLSLCVCVCVWMLNCRTNAGDRQNVNNLAILGPGTIISWETW